MAKKVTVTRTEENLTDDMGLEGWLLELGTDPEVQAVHVWKQNPRGGWTRLPTADLAPPFDGAPSAIFERHGDGAYRFVGIGPRMKFRGGSRDVPVAGYGEGSTRAAPPGPGATSAATGALEAMRETVDQMRLEVQMASLQRMLDRMNPPAVPGEGPLSREERALLHQEALDRDLERVSKLKALMGGEGRPADPLGLAREVFALAKEVLGGARGGNPLTTLKDSLELLSLARETLGAGAAGEEGWTGIIRDLIRNPQLLQNVRDMVVAERAAGRPAPPPPPARLAPPRPAPAPPVSAPSPTPAAAAAMASAPPQGADGQGRHPWEVLQTTILPALVEAAARGDRDFVKYAELIDRHLPPAGGHPGALEEFTQYDFPTSLERLAQLEPRLREPGPTAWLQEFYTFIRDDYFLPEEATGDTTEAPPSAEGRTA